MVRYYPGHDGFDYICVLCPENYTMSVENCQGETITTSIHTTCRCPALYLTTKSYIFLHSQHIEYSFYLLSGFVSVFHIVCDVDYIRNGDHCERCPIGQTSQFQISCVDCPANSTTIPPLPFCRKYLLINLLKSILSAVLKCTMNSNFT